MNIMNQEMIFCKRQQNALTLVNRVRECRLYSLEAQDVGPKISHFLMSSRQSTSCQISFTNYLSHIIADYLGHNITADYLGQIADYLGHIVADSLCHIIAEVALVHYLRKHYSKLLVCHIIADYCKP